MGSDTKPAGESLASRIRSADKARLLAIEHAQERMRASFPRLQMSLIVALTGGSGLLASFLLLHGGIQSMALRYPAAVALAYVVFLLLLWVWLRTTRREWIDAADIPPALLAEVVVDGALTYALYRRVRVEESRSWLMAACRRTAIPFAVTAIFVSCIGAGMSMYAPGAGSIGEVIHHAPK